MQKKRTFKNGTNRLSLNISNKLLFYAVLKFRNPMKKLSPESFSTWTFLNA